MPSRTGKEPPPPPHLEMGTDELLLLWQHSWLWLGKMGADILLLLLEMPSPL